MFRSCHMVMLTIASTSMLGACATVPRSLQGHYANISVSTAQDHDDLNGTPVRWGGQIIKIRPGPQSTCFYVLARTLNSYARPRPGGTEPGQGRFVACHAGFYDPEVFTHGRDLTVTGTLYGKISQKVGDYEYAYPRVEARVIYIWPKKRPVYVRHVHAYYPYGFYHPFWYPYWHPHWHPFWGIGWGP